MPRPKGTPKTGGRKKGTPNRHPPELKAAVSAFVASEWERLPRLLQEVTPAERLQFFAKVLPFAIAKKTEISIQEETRALLENIEDLTTEQLERLKEIINDATNET